jgi:ribosomal protein S18 acetylase RimI-like enzyme
MTTIRKAEPSDAKFILLLLEQLGYPDFDENDVKEKINRYDRTGYCMLVAEKEKGVIGFISLHWFDLVHWKGKLGRITAFCVDQNHRSQGIGKKMLQAAESILLGEGCIKLEVTSNLNRADAHAFYLKAGYIEDSRRFVKYREGKRTQI